MALNARQRLFVKAYALSKSAVKAAVAAGYSAKGARTEGPKLLRNPAVAQAVEVQIRRLERETELTLLVNGELTKERWLAELKSIALTTIDEVATVDAKGRVIATPTADRNPLAGRAIKKISGGKHGPVIELHSKQAALDTLGRSCGWVKDGLELSSKDGAPLVVLTMPSNGREALPESPVPLPPPPEPESGKPSGGS